ncbi:MAG: hypothetical protein ABGX26_05015 [Nautiliaceae bacterium]
MFSNSMPVFFLSLDKNTYRGFPDLFIADSISSNVTNSLFLKSSKKSLLAFVRM